ncbi:hypothetical protein ACIBI8_01735 [Streptomyces sp. NPDC050529]|uniref:hypothetical protein n=1 Tax=Streptomyces sp. NPDC050529 TaxID=3365624 RepID=UPI0037B2C584
MVGERSDVVFAASVDERRSLMRAGEIGVAWRTGPQLAAFNKFLLSRWGNLLLD